MLITDPEILAASESIAITNKAAELRAAGKEIATLSIGDTHFKPPEAVRMRMIEAINSNKTHYTAPAGIMPLRSLIAENFFNRHYKTEEILMVPGLKQGLFYLFEALPGKSIAAIEPAWLGYRYTAVMAGRQYSAINRYSPNWLQDLAEADFQTLVVCAPNNPDGYEFSAAEISQIMAIALIKDAWVVIDSIYDHFLYEGTPTAIGAIQSYNKIIFCNGFSKSHAMTGLRLGFLGIPDKKLFATCLRIQEHMATCPSSVAQYGALGFPDSTKDITNYRNYYARNRNDAVRIMPQLKKYLPQGGFYFFVNLADFGHANGAAFAGRLLTDHGVAVVPGAAYGSDFESYIRISFSIDNEEFMTGISKIKACLESDYGK